MTRLRWMIGLLIWGLFGAILGIVIQVVVIENSPPVYESNAKLIFRRYFRFTKFEEDRSMEAWPDPRATAIEVIESAESRQRTMERMNAIHPELASAAVTIHSNTIPGSAILSTRGTSEDSAYLRHYLNALLDEYVSHTQRLREQSANKVASAFLQIVVSQQKEMEEANKELQALREQSESTSVRIEKGRLPERLKSLRNERDDLRLSPTSKLPAIEAEIQRLETQLDEYEAAATKTRVAAEHTESAKKAYEMLFEYGENNNYFPVILSSCAEYVVILERATPPIKMPTIRLIGVTYPAIGTLFGLLVGYYRQRPVETEVPDVR